ncbi:MAG: glycoside hydrolase family 127 protein [Planctomycetota bacterium]|jgi:DUF1680 family protein
MNPIPAAETASRVAARPLPLSDVKVGGFLGAWRGRNNRESLLAGLEGALRERFEKLSRGEDPGKEGRLASDSDLFKWMEGCAYALVTDPDNAKVREELERTVDMVIAAQREDGFLTSRVGEEAAPFTLRNHDLYCCGHYLEAAVAHFGATGSHRMLESACRFADFYLRKWQEGHEYFDARVGEREHAEIELALVRLHRATGERKYLDFAMAVTDMATLAPRVRDLWIGGGKTHCVRVGYYLAACAEIYADTGEERYREPLEPLWEEIVSTLTYVTGGVGTGEKFPFSPFELPQRGDIAETCASIAMIMWGRRMHGLTGEAKYFDAMETALYNNVLGALSLDSRGIYYYQPLFTPRSGADGRHWPGGSRARVSLPELHRTSCCFPNIWRFLPALGEYLCSTSDSGICVNLYSSSTVGFRSPSGETVALEVETDYPHDGSVKITVDAEQPARFDLRLRIPAWCPGSSVTVNGERTGNPVPGYYVKIERAWQGSDVVELDLPMRAEALRSRPEIADNAGQVAFRRGPLVYCLEDLDAQGIDLERVVLLSEEAIEGWEPGLLGGVHALQAQVAESSCPDEPYPPSGSFGTGPARTVKLVPFCARANRAEDPAWRVWLPKI